MTSPRYPSTSLLRSKAKIAGVESNGMWLSERGLGLTDGNAGIVELPPDAPVGAPYATVAGLDDPVFELAITPNRGDCLGVHGLARDLAASGLGRLKPLRAEPIAGTFESPIDWRRDFPKGAGEDRKSTRLNSSH